MKWTTETPKTEGWYWFRDKNWRKAPETRGALIVRLRHVDTLGMLFCDGRLPQSVNEWPGEWAGPIPVPSKKSAGEPSSQAPCAPSDTDRLNWLQETLRSVEYQSIYADWIIQSAGQVVGNIGKGCTAREAIDKAMANDSSCAKGCGSSLPPTNRSGAIQPRREESDERTMCNRHRGT